MLIIIKKFKSIKIILPILLLSGLLYMAGCYTSAPSRGWSGPIVSDGILYVGTIQNNVIALNASTGQLTSWEEKALGETSSGGFICGGRFSQPMSTYSTPVVKNGVVYVGGYDGYVYSFTTATGAQNDFETGGAIVGSPVVADDTVFIGSSDGKLYALDLQLSPTPKWEFETGDKIWSTPLVDNGVVYIGSSDRRLYALDATNGKEIWHFEAEANILSTPVINEGTVYIGASDSKFYAIDVNQGEKEAKAKWVFDKAGNWFWTKALIYNSKVWVGNLDHNLYVINIEDPEDYEVVLETGGRITTPPVLVEVDDTNNMIVVGSEDGYLYTIDPEDNSSKQLSDLGAPILAPIYAPDTVNGVIYVHAQDGSHILYAIDAATGTEIWHYTTSGD